MLVLSRKACEELVFPALGVTLKVLRIKGSVVQLGIEAPGTVRVVRREALEKRGLVPELAEVARHSTDHRQRNELNSVLLRLQLALDTSLPAEMQLEQACEILQSQRTTLPACPPPDAPAVGPSLLVVDDDANERSLFASVLRWRGFQVTEAADGADALHCLGTRPRPDAVLLDIEMPRIDGEIALRSIRCDPRLTDLKVFAVSGMEPRRENLPDDCRGFDAWFTKPLDVHKLCQVLTALTPPAV